MLQGTAKLNQKMPFNFSPDQPLDGKLIATKISGDGFVQDTDPTLGLTGFVRPGPNLIAGDVTVIEFRGDADPSSEISELVETIEITFTAPNAQTLGGVLGTAVPNDD